MPTLKERIGSLLGDTTTADVTFVVGEEQVRIPAHSQVMSTASDSFKAMFFHDFNREKVVEIPDASPGGFRATLRYIYTDEADITEDNVKEVVHLSDKYLLTGLFAECVEWVKRNVSAENVCRFLPLGELYSDIGEVCWELALGHGKDALKTEAFLSLPRDQLAKMFASDKLAADEVTIYSRATDWAKRQLETNAQQNDPAAIRAMLGDVLYLIRFPLFDPEEFAKGPAESGVLPAEECVSVFQWLNAKKKPALFSVVARCSSLLDIDDALRQLDVLRRGTCGHERGVKIAVRQLRKLCETARAPCQHGSAWICLTCNEAFCGSSNSCGLYQHSEQTQHGLHFYTVSDTIYCGMCKKFITCEL